MNEITGHTTVFGILADPIHHVKTPQRINALFQSQGFDGVMVPIHVKPQDLETVLAGLRGMHNLAGCVITVPHKTAITALCDELTDAARAVGAVNVIHRRANGQVIGTMLDGEGFVAGLRQAGIEPRGRSAWLAGAGGAASAIAVALARSGVSRLTLHNRTRSKAQDLLARVQAMHPQLSLAVGSEDAGGHDLVVNATSLGMAADDPLPLDASRLQASQIVAEIIMTPADTALLQAARARGCRVHPGAPMLAAQIALMAAFMRNGTLT